MEDVPTSDADIGGCSLRFSHSHLHFYISDPVALHKCFIIIMIIFTHDVPHLHIFLLFSLCLCHPP